jgi:hypothetical protein
MRYLLVSTDVRQHRLISRDYIKTLPVTAEVASSSLVVPAIHSKELFQFHRNQRGQEKGAFRALLVPFFCVAT